MTEFKGKVAFIAGGGGGIGLACARVFLRKGCQVALFDLSARALGEARTSLASLVEKPEQEILIVQGDISKDTSCEEAIKTTVNHFKRLDFLLNCAGMTILYETIDMVLESRHPSQPEGTHFGAFDLLSAINLKGPLMLMHFAAPHLKSSHGAIVNVTSFAAIRGFEGMITYASTKAALVQMTKMVANELSPDGVKVNCVSPGIVATELRTNNGFGQEQEDSFRKTIAELEFYGRLQTAEEVAEAIAFLASGRSPYINGSEIPLETGFGNMLASVELKRRPPLENF